MGGTSGVSEGLELGNLEYRRCCLSTVAKDETVRGIGGALCVGLGHSDGSLSRECGLSCVSGDSDV